MAESPAPPSAALAAAGTIARAARRETLRFGALVGAVDLLLPLSIYAYARINGYDFWRFFSVEDAPTEWFSSVQCMLVAGTAWANYALHAELRRNGVSGLAERAWLWLVFAASFAVLGLDERFDLHEALRDQVLRPNGIVPDIQYIVFGDVGLYLVLVVGAVFGWLLQRELRRWRPAALLFCVALGLAIPVVVIDSLTDEALRAWPAWRFWDYSFEEIGELWSQLFFLLSFLVVLHGRLGQLERPEALAADAERGEPA